MEQKGIPEDILKEWIEKAKPLVDSAFDLGVDRSIDVVQDMRDRLKTGDPMAKIEFINLMDAVVTLLVNLKSK